MAEFLNNLSKIRLRRNTKRPTNKWSDIRNHSKHIDNAKFNVGIVCGAINNVFVLDIDIKDDGMIEFDNYLKDHGEPKTLTIRTPSGGTHYYFSMKSDNQDTQYIMKQVCYTRSKIGGFGIDIRSNKGYIVAPPSVIDGVEYQIINNSNINEMPKSLADYLLKIDVNHIYLTDDKQGCRPSEATILDVSNYKYEVDNTLIIKLLKLLGDDYLNDFGLWFKITSILKGLDNKELWKSWSKQSNKYNSTKNKYYWKLAKPVIDINYVVYMLRKKGHKVDYVIRYKKYEPLTITDFYHKKIDSCKQYVSDILTYEDFEKYETIIIKSCTGTGKTTAIAKHIDTYLRTNKCNVLTLTTRTTLSDQHVRSFETIDLKHYRKVADITREEHLTLCLNSLHRLLLDISEFEYYVVYIDEIASFLEFTHNKTIDNNIATIYGLLMDIVKHAKKIIVSDALIHDNVVNFLTKRLDKQTIFIDNTYKRYEGVKAIRMRDENKLLDQLLLNCSNNDYFLFGCDSNDTVTKFYTYCRDKSEESDKDKYVLITADTDFEIFDANEQFTNKFVFYSPKITFGIDFSYDLPQDVFIYVKGRTINPFGIFQQTTRTRNMRQLYYYCETFNQQEQYRSMSELKETLLDNISKSEILNKLCSYYNESEDRQLIENTFLKLYVYNEYVNDILNTDKFLHFRDILVNNGFVLSEAFKPRKLDKDTREGQTALVEDISNELFTEYCSSNNRADPKFDHINVNLELLGLKNRSDEILASYKDTIINKYKLSGHFSIMRMFKSDDTIKEQLNSKSREGLKTKLLKSDENKILLLRKVEAYYNIKPLDVSMVGGGEFKALDDDTFNNIKYSFETKKSKPTTYKELRELYICMIKHLTTKEIVLSKQCRTKEQRNEYTYTLNDRLIEYHVELSKYKCKKYNAYQTWFIEKYNLPTHSTAEGCDPSFLDCD